MFARFRSGSSPEGSGSSLIGGSRRGAGFGTLLAAVALLVGVLALAAASSQSGSGAGLRQVASKRCSSAQVGPIRARDCRGPAGARGPRGLPGPQGGLGLLGPQGPVGLTGPQGETGPQGFMGAQGVKGVKGDKGDPGANGGQGNPGTPGMNGTNGAPGPSTAFAASDDTIIGGNPGSVVVVSKTVPAGSYAINAKLSLNRGIDDADFDCFLRAQGIGNIDESKATLQLESINETLALQGSLSNYAGGTIDVTCSEPGPSDGAAAFDAKLTAIQVGSVQ